jgi:tRNA (cmo5U34)-methyltransferase
LHRWLKPAGRLYIADLIIFDAPEVQQMMWRRYGRYLESLGGTAYREKVFVYIHKFDAA